MHDVLNAAANGWVRALIKDRFVDIRDENAGALAPLYVGPKYPAFWNMSHVQFGACNGQLCAPDTIGSANK